MTPPGEPQTTSTAGAAEQEAIDREIERLIEPGLRANAWRPDYPVFRQRRLWDEQFHGRRVRILRQELRRAPRGGILDVGSGRGGLAVALRREGYRVVTADLRHRNCRVGRLRGRRYALDIPAVCARAEALPFGTESLGAVICRDVLEHCERPAHVLAEIWRVLRAGGVCYITVINRLCWVDPHYHLAGISLLPRPLAERYIACRGRSKTSTTDRQRLSDLQYYFYAEFIRWAQGYGFAVRDLRRERLHRYRRTGPAHWVRWLRDRLLRPLSLQSADFEFVLAKPSSGRTGRSQ